MLTLVGGLAAPFVLKNEDGQPLITWDEVQSKNASQNAKARTPRIPDFSEELSSLKEMASSLLIPNSGKNNSSKSSPVLQTTKVYTWQDDQGVTHFSNRPNPQGNSHVKYVQPMKIIPATDVSSLNKKQNQKNASNEKSRDQKDQKDQNRDLSLSDIKTLIKDAKNIQALADNRKEEMDMQINRH